MTIYWPDTPNAADSGDGLAFEVPDEVLRRHGARVLEPSTAAKSEAGPPVQPTAYASSVLLIPKDELARNNDTLNRLLNEVGMRLPDFRDDQNTPPDDLDTVPVVLQPLGRSIDVDAWTALQSIRAGADKELANRISLDHLMFASGWTGDLTGVPGAIQGFVPPFSGGVVASGYLDGPVAVELPAIDRTGPLALGRPAVVAVLDTGIGYNTWLEIPALDTGEKDIAKWQTGPYVKVDSDIQQAVRIAGEYLRQQGHRVEVITHPKDEPLTRNPLVGTQAWCFGHGEFCAGIIAQIAPQAAVLAVRVMGTDGVARESAVVAALKKIAERVASGDAAKMVDVVSLSMGYPFERPEPEEHLSPLALQIKTLRELGVLVVAAAGNSASSQRFFPACLSTHVDTVKLATPPVISVGALNPNGSKALFTNEGPSVTCYATGTNVISTFPQDANASRQPAFQVDAKNRSDLPPYRQSPDVDDHRHSPFGVWTGSSFAAPHVAAHLANALQGMAPMEGTGTPDRAKKAVHEVKTAANPKPPAPAT